MNLTFKFQFSLMVILFVGIALAACDSDNGSSGGAGIDLVGVWESDCHNDGSADRIVTLTFTETNVDQDIEEFTDSSCMTPTGGIVSGLSGSYSIGGAVNTADGTAYEIDFVISVSVTLLDLVQVNSDQMYLSGNANTTVRPTSLNTGLVYHRQ